MDLYDFKASEGWMDGFKTVIQGARWLHQKTQVSNGLKVHTLVGCLMSCLLQTYYQVEVPDLDFYRTLQKVANRDQAHESTRIFGLPYIWKGLP